MCFALEGHRLAQQSKKRKGRKHVMNLSELFLTQHTHTHTHTHPSPPDSVLSQLSLSLDGSVPLCSSLLALKQPRGDGFYKSMDKNVPHL